MKIHTDIQEQIEKAINKDKMSHAILLSGKSGYGTLIIAHWIAKRLICSSESPSCKRKVDDFQHADYHFCYPITSTETVKKPTTDTFRRDWQAFYQKMPFGSIYDWMNFIGAEKKQGIINAEQAVELTQKLSLRSYEGGNKVMLIWGAESMNTSFANKILKILEEPPQNTYFIIVSEKAEELLPTILSRCQKIEIPRLSEQAIASELEQQCGISREKAMSIASLSEGDFNIALEQVERKTEEFEKLFIDWVRNAFIAKKKISALKNIYDWAMAIAEWKSREKEKQFLAYCSNNFRQALLQNYGADSLAYLPINNQDFKWNIFARYIHGANIELIMQEINEASYHIERNGYNKLVFLDLGIKMIRHIHTYESK